LVSVLVSVLVLVLVLVLVSEFEQAPECQYQQRVAQRLESLKYTVQSHRHANQFSWFKGKGWCSGSQFEIKSIIHEAHLRHRKYCWVIRSRKVAQ